MKLSHKFSIIVLLTILEIFILTFMSLNGSKKMQEMKNLQYVQASTETQLSELINYLNKLDFWAFTAQNAYRDWEEKASELNDNFEALGNSKVLKEFSPEFRENIDALMNLWYLFKARFTEIEGFLKEIESFKFPMGYTTSFDTDGIRATAEKYPEEEDLQAILSDVEFIHEQMPAILKAENTLK